MNNFNLSPDHAASHFAFEFMGCLNVSGTEVYTFSLATTNAITLTNVSKLYLDGSEVIHQIVKTGRKNKWAADS